MPRWERLRRTWQPAPIHSDRMVIDEMAMAAGIALHTAVALSPGTGDNA
ncbi:hypothetical protein [Streptomyces galilaeus]